MSPAKHFLLTVGYTIGIFSRKSVVSFKMNLGKQLFRASLYVLTTSDDGVSTIIQR